MLSALKNVEAETRLVLAEVLDSARKMSDIERQIFERLDERKTYLETIGGFFDW